MNEDLCRCTHVDKLQCVEGGRSRACVCPCRLRASTTPQTPKLLNAVRGTIPDLLCRCAPVVHRRTGTRDVVRELRGEAHMRIAGAELLMWIGLEDWDLDLTDPVGCWIAACWANERSPTYLTPTDPHGEDEGEVAMLAMLKRPLTPTQVDMLARLVLRLAGED